MSTGRSAQEPPTLYVLLDTQLLSKKMEELFYCYARVAQAAGYKQVRRVMTQSLHGEHRNILDLALLRLKDPKLREDMTESILPESQESAAEATAAVPQRRYRNPPNAEWFHRQRQRFEIYTNPEENAGDKTFVQSVKEAVLPPEEWPQLSEDSEMRLKKIAYFVKQNSETSRTTPLSVPEEQKYQDDRIAIADLPPPPPTEAIDIHNIDDPAVLAALFFERHRSAVGVFDKQRLSKFLFNVADQSMVDWFTMHASKAGQKEYNEVALVSIDTGVLKRMNEVHENHKSVYLNYDVYDRPQHFLRFIQEEVPRIRACATVNDITFSKREENAFKTIDGLTRELIKHFDERVDPHGTPGTAVHNPKLKKKKKDPPQPG